MRRFVSTVAATVLLLSGTGYAEPATPIPGQPAGWSWFSDPRAVNYGGCTFVGFTAGNGVWVGVYHDAAGTWSATQVGTVAAVDDHNAPAVGVRPDGRILVAWAENGGAVYRRVSTNPGDITSWGPTGTLLTGRYAYVNLLRLDSGVWFLFTRRYETGGGRTNLFMTSTDEGFTWSAPVDWVASAGKPYAKFAAAGDRIDVAITTGHPADGAGNSLYHVYYDGAWRASDGTDLGPPPFTVEDFTKVHDGAAVNAWVWDMAPGPVIVFSTFPTVGDHRYQYAKWAGSWSVREVTAAGGSIDDTGGEPYYSGGIVLDHADPNHAYLSRQAGPGWWVMEHWWTGDGGATWASRGLATGAGKNIRPVVTRGGGLVVWLGGTYTGYHDWAADLAAAPARQSQTPACVSVG